MVRWIDSLRPQRQDRAAHQQTIEAFRLLRSQLEVVIADLERPVVVITSPRAGEGKTLTCAQLASALTKVGRRVVAVDLDLRHPDLHNCFGASNDSGAADVLAERQTLERAMQVVRIRTGPHRDRPLYLLSAGRTTANPDGLLASTRLARLLDSLRAQADMVLIDTAPVLPVADTLVVTRAATGAVLVVEARSTLVTDAEAAKDTLIRNQTRLLGLVINKIRPRDGAYFGLGYGYGDSEESVSENPEDRSVSSNGPLPEP